MVNARIRILIEVSCKIRTRTDPETLPEAYSGTNQKKPVLWIQIRIRIQIRRIHNFLGLPDSHPDPLDRGTDRIRIRTVEEGNTESGG